MGRSRIDSPQPQVRIGNENPFGGVLETLVEEEQFGDPLHELANFLCYLT